MTTKLKTQDSEIVKFGRIVTRNAKMKSCIHTAEMAGRASDVTILLLGENGVGKDIMAEAVHAISPRKDGPYIAVNCSALSETLLESELFGHEKGAFTSADRRRKGKFELADKGTLFLDEIGDMSSNAQAKILRACEHHMFERIGGEDAVHTNARIVAATNRSLAELVAQGRFREDLYYRLNEVCIEIPPLRERKEDISLLIDIFVEEFNKEFDKKVMGVSDVTLQYLMQHQWPGNIRELKSVIKRGMLVTKRDSIWLEDLSFQVELQIESVEDMGNRDFSLKTAERSHIQRVLQLTKGVKKQACDLLRISRSTLDKKIEEYKLSVPK
jgi:transcriptional regulator with PAS, ATPase and Fis domain